MSSNAKAPGVRSFALSSLVSLAVVALTVTLILMAVQVAGDNDVGKSDGSSGLDKALATAKTTQESITEALKVMNKMDLPGVFNKVAKALIVLGPVFMLASTVLSIVSIFMPQAESEEVKLIRAGFEKVNYKLDGLFVSTENIKELIELVGAKQSIVKAVDSIHNLEQELQFTMKHKSRQGFKYYARSFDQTYDYAAEKVWAALMGHNTTSEYQFDLLALYRDHYKCNQLSIMKMCISGIQIINKGINLQTIYFSVIRYPRRSRNLIEVWKQKLQKLEERCTSFMMECESNYRHWFESVFNAHYLKHVIHVPPKEYAIDLQASLTDAFPFRHWAVFASYDSPIANDQCSFSTPSAVGERLSQNGRHVIAMSTPRSSVFPHYIVDILLRGLADDAKTTNKCTSLNQGPFYYKAARTTIERFEYAKHSHVNVAACPQSGQPFMATPNNHQAACNVGPSYCVTTPLRVYAFL